MANRNVSNSLSNARMALCLTVLYSMVLASMALANCASSDALNVIGDCGRWWVRQEWIGRLVMGMH